MDGVAGALRVPDLTGLDRDGRVAALRTSLAAIGAAAPAPVTAEPAAAPGDRALPVPGELGDVLAGCLIRGAVTAVDAPGALLAAITAAVTADGLHVAVVAVPELLAAPVLELGGDLSRILIVDEPGEAPLEVIATLADGVDLVIAALPQVPPPSLSRPLSARLRRAGTALAHVGAPWPQAAAAISSRVTAIHGLGRGHGRIRAVEYQVTAALAGRPGRCGGWVMGDRGVVKHTVTHTAEVVDLRARRRRR